uniref:Uncharacterized protein n=1 Tax=Arundo donax TaxID=35708 RepID=A0A0A9AQK6_ARUDO
MRSLSSQCSAGPSSSSRAPPIHHLRHEGEGDPWAAADRRPVRCRRGWVIQGAQRVCWRAAGLLSRVVLPASSPDSPRRHPLPGGRQRE